MFWGGVTSIALVRAGKYDFSGNPVFYHLHGSSWHADDAAFVFFLDAYRYHFIALGCLVVGVLGYVWHLRRKNYSNLSFQDARLPLVSNGGKYSSGWTTEKLR